LVRFTDTPLLVELVAGELVAGELVTDVWIGTSKVVSIMTF
jgi:hypothetical protein